MKDRYLIYKIKECRRCKGKGKVQNIICFCGDKGYEYEACDLLDVLKKLRWTVSGDATEIQQWGKFEEVEIDD